MRASNIRSPTVRVRIPNEPIAALSAPALAVVAVPAAQAGAAPLKTEERDPAAGAGAGAVRLMTAERVGVVGGACASWWRQPAGAPMSCAGCPARPVAWRCRESSAPGRRRVARHFAAWRRDHAQSSRAAAATREKGPWARSMRPSPVSSTQQLRLAQMLPAARTLERQVGSVARRRSRGRTAGSSPAATTAN